jgi:hypothetical protein
VLDDLRPDEDVVLHIRQHWISPALQALPGVGLALVPLGISLFISLQRPVLPFPWWLLVVIGLGGLFTAALAWLGWVYIRWDGNTIILTNQRIVRLHLIPFIYEWQGEIPLDSIENVQTKSDGLLPLLLGYGDVQIHIRSAGSITLANAPRPADFRELVFRLIEPRKQQRAQQQRAQLEAAVRAAIGWSEPAGKPAPEEDPDTATRRAVSNEPITWHRHWWFLITLAGPPALGLVLMIVASWWVVRLPGVRDELAVLLVTALVGLGTITLAWLIWQVLVWRGDIYQVRGDRLLDIVRAPFGLRQETNETTFDRVQNISLHIPSPLAWLLDYGDVRFETAGEKAQVFTFDGVANPRAVRTTITERLEAAREARARQQQESARAEMLNVLGTYYRLTHDQQAAPEGEA